MDPAVPMAFPLAYATAPVAPAPPAAPPPPGAAEQEINAIMMASMASEAPANAEEVAEDQPKQLTAADILAKAKADGTQRVRKSRFANKVPTAAPGDEAAPSGEEAPAGEASAGRRRKSRWASELGNEKRAKKESRWSVGQDTRSKEQREVADRLADINKLIVENNYTDTRPPEERSPSPEPAYDVTGKRTNTREQRYRQKIEKERADLIQKQMMLNPLFSGMPAFMKKPSKKIFVPIDEHPEINFIGLIIGPRGNTQKKMQAETGAQICIRGKGSIKEGKQGRRDGKEQEGSNDPLHVYLEADTEEQVEAAAAKIHFLINPSAELEEYKAKQIMELQIINGTAKDPKPTQELSLLQTLGNNFEEKILQTLNQQAQVEGQLQGLSGLAGTGASMEDEYASLMKDLGMPSTGPAAAAASASAAAPRPPPGAPPLTRLPQVPSGSLMNSLPRPPPGAPPAGNPPQLQVPMGMPMQLGHAMLQPMAGFAPMAYGMPGMQFAPQQLGIPQPPGFAPPPGYGGAQLQMPIPPGGMSMPMAPTMPRPPPGPYPSM